MPTEPEDDEDDQQEITEDDDWADSDKPPSDERLNLVLLFFMGCLGVYILWAFFALCGAFFGAKVYVPLLAQGRYGWAWIIVAIVTLTTIAAIFMPLDED